MILRQVTTLAERYATEAYQAELDAADYRDFADHLGDILRGFEGSPWVKNEKSLELLSKLQSGASEAFDEADAMLAKARHDFETSGQDALDTVREAMGERE